MYDPSSWHAYSDFSRLYGRDPQPCSQKVFHRKRMMQHYLDESSSSIPLTIYKPDRSDSRCRLCKQLSIDATWQSIEHYTYLNLKISASRGCHVCRFLYECILSSPQAQDFIARPLKIYGPTSSTFRLVDYASNEKHFELFSKPGE
jgi:hypothetical protein